MLEPSVPFVRVRVTVVLRHADGRLCFVRHLKQGRRYWLLPGGGQQPFEPLEEAARREIHEELRISVSGLNFLAMRETMSSAAGRHIQFPIFEAVGPDFSTLEPGEDPRVEGIDFFTAEELANRPIFPNMEDDILRLARGERIAPFRTLEWVP
ncbi:MAG TPA: NUDIX domain-containing protein [Candidatus Ozemobacteraceae bacterium]|nr:NUDIX domain-containing protein [Candidatus Ozemobacteraceae bacterium]